MLASVASLAWSRRAEECGARSPCPYSARVMLVHDHELPVSILCGTTWESIHHLKTC